MRQSSGRPSRQRQRERIKAAASIALFPTDREGRAALGRVSEARQEAGVTQAQVARALGKTQSHVSMCESREREISIIDLWKWCGAIGISMGDFINRFEAEVRQQMK
jgi:DNA-binding XRE family transcriptional regulator